MAQLALNKYHGLRNDFLVCLNDNKREITQSLILHMCDRIEGVGADGFISVEPPSGEDADFSVRWWNADGSTFQMSGNGIRCAAHCVVDRGIHTNSTIRFETPAGIRSVEVGERIDGTRRMMSANMGVASILPLRADMVDFVGDLATDVAFVDVGNPHLVFRDDAQLINMHQWGARAQEAIEGGINVEFGAVENESLVNMRVYERGVGPTLACGTGATALAAALHDWNVIKDEVVIRQAGGDATLKKQGEEWILSSPTVYVSSVNVDVAD